MQVFLIRHAQAIDETHELRDPQRHLTALGRTQATSLGDRLRWHDCAPSQVWTSPLVRAVQTAELVLAGLRVTELAVEVIPGLAPGDSPHMALARLNALPADAGAIVVGHEPGLSALAALLVGQSEFGALAKAEAVRIVDGKLRWRFTWDADAPS